MAVGMTTSFSETSPEIFNQRVLEIGVEIVIVNQVKIILVVAVFRNNLEHCLTVMIINILIRI